MALHGGKIEHLAALAMLSALAFAVLLLAGPASASESSEANSPARDAGALHTSGRGVGQPREEGRLHARMDSFIRDSGRNAVGSADHAQDAAAGCGIAAAVGTPWPPDIARRCLRSGPGIATVCPLEGAPAADSFVRCARSLAGEDAAKEEVSLPARRLAMGRYVGAIPAARRAPTAWLADDDCRSTATRCAGAGTWSGRADRRMISPAWPTGQQPGARK